MRAILSDIHGNLEALEAVLADAARHGADELYCLGDLVGYGPNPVECVERSTAWDLVLLGNFDQAAVHEPDFYPPSALQSIDWFHKGIGYARGDPVGGNRWVKFLSELPLIHEEDGTTFVHGTPRWPTHEYLFPEDTLNPQKMAAIGDRLKHNCFCGHTHVPGVFVEESPGNWAFHGPAETRPIWRFDGRKTIVNVGSVGQPRDGDWRACYVLLDGWDVTFRRVEYDVEATVRKIYAIPELANFLGDRLREGR